MKVVDKSLQHIIHILVLTCIILYNMCTNGKYRFDMKWIENAEKEMNMSIENNLL